MCLCKSDAINQSMYYYMFQLKEGVHFHDKYLFSLKS